jgi:EAL and modified HD-GYP domain-containing signal transduction protein
MTGELRYMARQPILDLRHRVHGYELLFRSGPELAFRGDGDLATRIMLDNSVAFGFDRLTCGLPAFVNCTTESLVEELVDVMPPRMTVLEILESVAPTPEVIAACRKLKGMGFRLALDDFAWDETLLPLVELADYIKVDFMATGPAERQQLLERLRGKQFVMVAEKVETQDEYRQARVEGFTLFQGYYFCRPELSKNRKIPPNRISQIQILKLLQEDPLDMHELSQLVKRDASLTHRLLRLVNSPLCAIRQEVRSIEVALIMVGDITFRHIATLAITSELNAGQPPEILRMAFVRGRFCEQAAGLCDLSSPEQYLLGLLSLLPAMLRISMADLAPSMPLREEIREALLGISRRERCLLEWLESYERADWDRCEEVVQSNGLNREELIRNYIEAVSWAETVLPLAT